MIDIPPLRAISLQPYDHSAYQVWRNYFPYRVSSDVYRYEVRFDAEQKPIANFDLFNQEPYHCEMLKWLKENCSGAFLMDGATVFFADGDDATLCYVSFSGRGKEILKP